MLLFTESFDGLGTTAANYVGKWASVSGGTVAAGGFHDNYANAGTWFYDLDAADRDDVLIVGFRYRLTGAPNNNRPITYYSDNQTNPHGFVHINGDRSVEWRRWNGNGGDTLIDSVSPVLQLNVWHYVEVKVKLGDGTSGTAEIRVDGATVASATGLDTKNGGTETTFSSVRMLFSVFGDNIDDLVILNEVDSGISGRPNNDFLGDVFVEALRPSGNGNSSQFVGSDADSTDNYLLVDEVTPDDDTTYVESGTDNNKDTYAYENTSGTGGVVGVVCFTRAKRTDADGRDLAVVSRLSTATPTEEDSADLHLASTYAWHRAVFEADPEGLVWTRAKVDSAEFGVKSRPL